MGGAVSEDERPRIEADEAVREAFFALLQEWDRGPSLRGWPHDPSDPQAATTEVNPLHDWLHGAQSAGWRRKDVYDLVWEVFRTRSDIYREETLDALGEFETALTGACHPASIVRFPSDPDSQEGLAAVARDPARW